MILFDIILSWIHGIFVTINVNLTWMVLIIIIDNHMEECKLISSLDLFPCCYFRENYSPCDHLNEISHRFVKNEMI